MRALLLIAVIVAMLPASAMAACSNPGGTAGDQIYNTSYNVMQFCNDTAWVNMGSVGAGGVADGDKGAITVSSSGSAWAIDAGAVTNTMLAGSIALSKLDTTGTASSSNYLRGDGVWSAVSLATGVSGNLAVGN